MAHVRTISIEELDRRLSGERPFEFWNVLTEEWFKGEMIPGSRRVPLDRLEREIAEARFAQDAEIVVYCGGPKCPQSRLAAEKLGELGFTRVQAYEGGLEEWKASGREIERVESYTAEVAG